MPFFPRKYLFWAPRSSLHGLLMIRCIVIVRHVSDCILYALEKRSFNYMNNADGLTVPHNFFYKEPLVTMLVEPPQNLKMFARPTSTLAPPIMGVQQILDVQPWEP